MSGGTVLSGGGFDIRKYSPYSLLGHYTFSDNNWHTVIDITGKGYVKKWGTLVSSSYSFMSRITIDDVVVFYARATSSSEGCLGVKENVWCNNGTLYMPVFYDTGSFGIANLGANPIFPLLDGSNSCSIISSLLYFKKSLKVEISCSGTTGWIGYYDFKGGVI
jgi:hypothetical protein